ncbi:MAG: metal ABC transporter permease, partial [Gemmatimonadaceae bacterium]|nr:metal ABC transporter permease [Gloeobacterales cyanobacterium ES-bin-141]
FLLLSFDPQWTEATGLPARGLHYTMMALTALTVVATMQAVGVALTIALMIIPAATAYLVTNRLTSMLQLSIGLGVASSLIGLYISYYQNLSSGPTITLVSSFFFILVVLFGPFLSGRSWNGQLKRLQGMALQDPVSPPAPAPQVEPVPFQTGAPAPNTSPKRIARDSTGKLIIQTPQPSQGKP